MFPDFAGGLYRGGFCGIMRSKLIRVDRYAICGSLRKPSFQLTHFMSPSFEQGGWMPGAVRFRE
jgi:hypothetical protein